MFSILNFNNIAMDDKPISIFFLWKWCAKNMMRSRPILQANCSAYNRLIIYLILFFCTITVFFSRLSREKSAITLLLRFVTSVSVREQARPHYNRALKLESSIWRICWVKVITRCVKTFPKHFVIMIFFYTNFILKWTANHRKELVKVFYKDDNR